MTRRIDLGGIWQKSVNGRPFIPQTVPYSGLCVGETFLKTGFSARPEGRIVLCFEGITYWAEVFLNGERLGEMLPYCRYRFDVSSFVKEENELTVRLLDRGM